MMMMMMASNGIVTSYHLVNVHKSTHMPSSYLSTMQAAFLSDLLVMVKWHKWNQTQSSMNIWRHQRLWQSNCWRRQSYENPSKTEQIIRWFFTCSYAQMTNQSSICYTKVKSNIMIRYVQITICPQLDSTHAITANVCSLKHDITEQ